MHPGSVKYWKRLTHSNGEVVASDYEEEEIVFRLLCMYPHSRLDSVIFWKTGIFRLYEYTVLIFCRSVLYEDYNVQGYRKDGQDLKPL